MFVLRFVLIARNIDANFTLALVYITALTLFIIGSVGYSALKAYGTKDALIRILADRDNRFTPEERLRLIRAIEAPPTRMRGFSRVVIALTVLLVLGVTLFSAITIGIPTAAEGFVTPVLGALTGLVAAITGFYYGGRQGQKLEEPEEERAGVTVEIANPAPGSVLDPGKYLVQGTASSDNSLEKIEIRLSEGVGAARYEGDWQPAEGTLRWKHALTLEKGKSYVIHARATDSVGNSAEAQVSVSVSDSGDMEENQPEPATPVGNSQDPREERETNPESAQELLRELETLQDRVERLLRTI